MFFSLLYFFTLIAILLFTCLTVRSIVKNEEIGKWLLGIVGVALIYLCLVAISIWV
ncbi:hypothetical protein [Lihuaxuella thermophila]|uniref:Uncharacterized protein n=1 Tax=Lihuaxuella thermophila TaxID=1173111 RepID=A0A1H8FB31_9BACL|nr:hypothetical protein [Lihuaxuella thermophila]SEN29081.1 hypothetical protein SAMN05444955_108114 [Lihuaxuella thermophila]